MKKTGFKSLKMGVPCISVAVLPLIVLLGALAEVKADEADAKRMMKAMSDYMAGEKAISFAYDSIFEVVTKDHQTIGLASSGTIRYAPARQDPGDTERRFRQCRDAF